MATNAKGIITTNDNVSWSRIVDVLNEVFNCGYGGYQSASWFPNGRDGEKVIKKPVAKEWDNFFDTEKISSAFFPRMPNCRLQNKNT